MFCLNVRTSTECISTLHVVGIHYKEALNTLINLLMYKSRIDSYLCMYCIVLMYIHMYVCTYFTCTKFEFEDIMDLVGQ